MKRIILSLLTPVLLALSAWGQHADDVKGAWLSEKKDVKVEIYQHGEKFYGRIIWGKDLYEGDGKTLKKDQKNPDEKLRERTMLNMVIFSGYTFQDGEWTGGEIYDPKSGKTYKSKMKISSGKLEIRGYLGSPMFGKTTVWSRAS